MELNNNNNELFCNIENPPPPIISLAWRNLSYTVTGSLNCHRHQPKHLLHRLTGHFTANSLNCLLGHSGAGKTTLLNILSGTATSGLCSSSEIFYNSSQRPTSYYIKQHSDFHSSIINELTVGQLLQYAFAFKNGAKRRFMQSHINTIMTALSLPEELQSRQFCKCSGGEQKRIAIAQELMSLNSPSYLLIDEATTGLDSISAYQTMVCLQQLAIQQKITVIASIHAPNTQTLALFGQLYVLAKGGFAVFSGPPSQLKSCINMAEIEQQQQQPPIEALLKIACYGGGDSKVIDLANALATSETAILTPVLPNLTATPTGLPSTPKAFTCSDLITSLCRLLHLTFIAQYKYFFFTPAAYLIFISGLVSIYSADMTTASGCISLVTSATNVTATCTGNVTDPRQFVDLVRENESYITFVVLLISFLSMVTSTVLYSAQVAVLESEYRNHWYSLSVFFTSSSLVSLVELTINALCAAILSYFLSQQHAADSYSLNLTRFNLYLLFIWLLVLYYNVTGQLIGLLLSKHRLVAILTCELVFVLFQLFNGLLVKLNRTENAVLELANDVVGMVFITRGLFCAIYGAGRCPNEQISRVLLNNSAEEGQIGEYVIRVLVNVAVIKLLTVVVLYSKFGCFGKWFRRRYRKTEIENRENEIVSIEKSTEKLPSLKANLNKQYNQSKAELVFQQFSRQKIVIAWKSLTLFGNSSVFEINPNATSEPILRQLSGSLVFGTLTALMGASGSGKTSLLRVLSGQSKSRLSEATTFYLSQFTPINACFITQEVSGHLLNGLTAKQALICASRLKNGHDVGVDHEAIAMKWLVELDLLETIDTRVEDCSGGERKRLAVALELTSLQMPNLICIDEPTSGLDSNSAEIVITTLRQLAHTHPLAIVTSIHQPTTAILRLFDQLYILARGGVCLFSGTPKQAQTHLSRLPSTQIDDDLHFPLEYLIKQSCLPYTEPINASLVKLNNEQFDAQPFTFNLTQQTQHTPDGLYPPRPRLSLHSLFNFNFRFLLYIRGHLWKQWLAYFLISLIYAINLRLLFPVSIRSPSGCINLEDDDLSGCAVKTKVQLTEELQLTDNFCYSYFLSNIYMYLVVVSSAVTFSADFILFANEHRNGWYSTGTYYLIRSFWEMIPVLLTNFPYIYLLNIYNPVTSTSLFWPLFLLLTLSQLSCLALGHCISLLARQQLLPATILCTAYTLMLLLGNTFIPYHRLHYIWQALSSLSTPRFLFENVMLLQYGFGRCHGDSSINIILYSMTLDDADYWPNIGRLLGIVVFFRIVAFWLLWCAVNQVEDRRRRRQRIELYRERMLVMA